MSGELQTIPARHGVATFVPRGRTIKVINTYGKQVVSMWAFTLGAPPEEGDDEPGAEEIEEEAKKLQQGAEGEDNVDTQSGGAEKQQSKESGSEEQHADPNVEKEKPDTEGKDAKEEHEDPPEQAPDTPQNESTVDTDKTGEADGTTPKQPSKRTWASYLPSIPYRAKGKGDKADKDGEQEPSPEEQKAQNEAITKKWSLYIPMGKGFSNYIPNVEVPSKEGVVSAFKSSHNRDPNKSYAEQLYDFSKTPVGAGTIAAATGSGYASSVYAAYSAYAQTHPSSSSNPPMEYLSLPHTRSSSYKLVPEVSDTLLTNLRNPIITLVEDSTPGAHDTLTAACDANLYTALGVSQPAEHGSCAENLVLALKELNESAGLKGTKAVGADISVNIAPTPLHLFMAAPLALAADAAPGSGARGARIAVEEPKGRKRGFVRFRAERDVVVVLSACPMDVGPQNGGRCMAANFMVEEEADTTGKAETDKADKTGKAETDKADKTDKTNKADQKHKADKTDKPVKPEKTDTTHKTSKSDNPDNPDASDKSCASAPSDAAAKPKKKPKKLEVRSKP